MNDRLTGILLTVTGLGVICLQLGPLPTLAACITGAVGLLMVMFS